MGKSSDEGWIANGLLVLGALGTLVAIGGWLLQDLLLLVAFVAGAGWALSISLLVMLRRAWQELRSKGIEVADLHRQVGEWRTVATNNSDSLSRFVAHAFEVPRVQPRRAPSYEVQPAAAGDNEAEE